MHDGQTIHTKTFDEVYCNLCKELTLLQLVNSQKTHVEHIWRGEGETLN